MNKIEDNLYFIQFARPDIYSKLVLRYNFLETGSTIKNNGINSGRLSANIIPFPYELWSTSGRGYFSGNYARITGINNFINYNDSTFIIDFEKIRVGSSTLISSITKDNILQYNEDGSTYFINVNQGFEFGVTANNNLYFEYFEPSGSRVFVQESNLSNKSSVYLNISNNTVNFGYFNFVQNSVINSNFNINSNFIYNPKNLYIGYNPESINSYNNNQPFLGYIDNFIVGSGLFNRELPFIYTGFIHDTYASGGALASGLVTGITGRRYEITGSGLYITGFQRTATGVIYDDWGFQTVGYTNSPLYGLRPLYGFTLLTGSFFQFFNEPLTISLKRNLNKFNNYNKDYIKFTTDKINDDLIEIGLITGDISKINNKNLFLSQNRFDYGYYLPNRTIENESLFINGQYQTSGELIDLSNSYNPDLIRIVKNDYGVENGKIVPFNLYGQPSSDSIFVDFNTGETVCYEDLYIESSISIPSLSNSSFNIFFNGQKLTENIHYSIDNNYDLRDELQNIFNSRSYRSSRINNDESVIIVGDYLQNTARGVVAIYTGNSILGWNVKQTITGILNNEFFGNSLATNSSANLLMIGSFGINKVSIYTGDANNGWKYKNDLPYEESIEIIEDEEIEIIYDAVGWFGYATTSNNDGTVLAVGAPFNNDRNGTVVIFTGDINNGWNFKQQLSSINNCKQIGNSMDTNNDGTILVVGAPNDQSNFTGSAIIYTGNSLVGWGIKNILKPSTQIPYFGWDVACNGMGNVCVIGNFGSSSGISIYTGDLNNEWVLKQVITGIIGSSIDINNNGTIIATAKNEGDSTIIFTGNLNIGWAFHQEIPSGQVSPYHGKHLSLNNDGSIFVQGAPSSSVNAGGLVYSSNNITFNNYSFYTGITGNLCFVPKNYDYSYIESGKPYSYSPQKYYERLSEIYVNGIRQSYNEDYNELSSLNLKTGVLFLEQLPDIIYNN
jgi:hypothetical protein